MAVNLDACIQCTRCVRACREEQVNDVIGYAYRGAHSAIVFDLDDPMGASTCVACGECVQACPTGALAPGARRLPGAGRQEGVVGVPVLRRRLPDHLPRRTTTTIVRVEGRDGPANHERLCVKGRFGFDYVSHPQRLTKPLIRKRRRCRRIGATSRSTRRIRCRCSARRRGTRRSHARAARSRASATSTAAARSRASARRRASNEEAYLFQKLVRTGFGTNNVDHCTRLCHASSVAALLEGIGSGAVSNPVMDVTQGRGRAADRRESGRQPSGRRDVDQERGQERDEADPRRSAPLGARAPRHALPAVQARHRRRAAERDDAHDRRGRTGRQRVRRRRAPAATRRSAKNVAAFSPEAMGPVVRPSGGDDPRGGARCSRRRRDR